MEAISSTNCAWTKGPSFSPVTVTLEYSPRMTIREHLKLVANCVGFGVMAVGLAIFFAWHSRHPGVSKDQALRWMLWMWLPLGAAMIILLNLLPGCPRCHTRYRRLKR